MTLIGIRMPLCWSEPILLGEQNLGMPEGTPLETQACSVAKTTALFTYVGR